MSNEHYYITPKEPLGGMVTPPGPWTIYIQSNLSYPNVDYPKLLGYSKTIDSPDLFPYYLLQ